MKRSTLQTRILLMIVIVVLVGILSTRFTFRLDFTGDKRYTLSNATKDILENIEEPVTVTAYFSKDLPPNVAETRSDFKDLLIEYVNRSDGNVVYEFLNPNENTEIEQKAQQAGIQPVMINVREKDQVKQQKAYLGAVLKIGEDSEVIPFVQPGAAMEYTLSSSIKKLAVKDKPRIGLLQGHGEPGRAAMQQVISVLSVLYNVETFQIADTSAITSEYKTVVIVAPEDSFSNMELMRLDEFIANGGNILAAVNKVKGDLSTSTGSPNNTGLGSWLKQKGIEVEEKFVMDANCGSVSVRQQQGFFTFNTPVNFPYLPLISNFADHPISKGLERVLMPFASPITYNFPDTSTQVVVLAETSKKSNTSSANTFFNVMQQYSDKDFPLSSLPVAVAVEGKLVGNRVGKLVVFGDGDFPVNGEGREYQQLQPDNVSLMVNAVDWLSDDTGLNELRTKAVTSRPIKEQLEDNEKMMVKYANFLIPIILIILYGFGRFQFRRRLRNKWMEESYV